MPTPTVLLVHGAFAESASWQHVLRILGAEGVAAIAVANPLRTLAGDAAYVADVARSFDGPVILVGHSYGGMVVTEAAASLPNVAALVYVGAFAPETGESALELSDRWPGSTLGDAIVSYPLAAGGNEFAIDIAKYPAQFAADVEPGLAAIFARTQRPVTEAALSGALGSTPAWKTVPSWFVFGAEDRNIPREALKAMAERADSRGTAEVAGASHSVMFSSPDAVAASILDAVRAISA